MKEKKNRSPFVILNGFDRSGTSAISKTLSKHDRIELIMQPFNSGFIRKRMYEVFGADLNKEVIDAELFFNNLQKKIINNDLIHSYWHHKYSTTKEFVPGKIHILKTTINHFVQKWMKEKYPEIDVWGVWRNPEEIVLSIMHNDFYGKWYKDAIELISPTIKSVNFLQENYEHLLQSLDSNIKRISFLIAVRTHFFLYYLDEDKLIDYHIFKKNANSGLQNFSSYYQLEEADFNLHSKEDLNIIGDSYFKKKESFTSKDDKYFMKFVFEKINVLKKEKFNYDKIS